MLSWTRPQRLMLRPEVAVFLGVLGLAGCAGQKLHTGTFPAPANAMAATLADASGVRDWVYRSNDGQGDMRVEQEEWHIVQHGTQIEGYYDRVVTMMSTDDRLFRCNQKLGFTKTTRVRVTGKV